MFTNTIKEQKTIPYRYLGIFLSSRESIKVKIKSVAQAKKAILSIFKLDNNFY